MIFLEWFVGLKLCLGVAWPLHPAIFEAGAQGKNSVNYEIALVGVWGATLGFLLVRFCGVLDCLLGVRLGCVLRSVGV